LLDRIEEKDKEIERLKEEIKGYEQERERVLNIIDERNHKAIEYIEYVIFLNGHNAFKDRILEILKGEDNE
jgi:hypothetical protein